MLGSFSPESHSQLLVDQVPGSESGNALTLDTLATLSFGPIPLGIPWPNSIICPKAWLFLLFWVFPHWWLAVHLKFSSKFSFIDSESHQQQLDTDPCPHPRTPFQDDYTVTRLLNTLCPALESDMEHPKAMPWATSLKSNFKTQVPGFHLQHLSGRPRKLRIRGSPVWLL